MHSAQKWLTLTCPYFVMKFRAAMTAFNWLFQLSHFSGHSFQAGAANTAVVMKVEDSIIGQMGECAISALPYAWIPEEELKGSPVASLGLGTA